jgi:C-terminal peptidase prc
MSWRHLTYSMWFIAVGIGSLLGQENVTPAQPDLAPTVGKQLEREYYDHHRFMPKVMVSRALRALETFEASIDTVWIDGHIIVTVAEKVIDIPADDPTNLEQAMALIEKVRIAVDGTDLSAERKRDIAYVLVNGALRVLDPHTVAMTPEQAKKFSEDIKGEFFGIGSILQQVEGALAIDRVMAGFPAEKAGVMDGDIIIGINGEKTAGLILPQAVRRIKGPKGSTVVLTVERKSAPAAMDISVVRDRVQAIKLRSYRRGEVGYVRMDEFNEFAARDLYGAVLELQKQGPLKAFVLDLRYNGGGLLAQANQICDFFLPKGEEIVRTVTSDGKPKIYSSSAKQLLDLPMVVMTSGGSASAAEILSGCLQRDERAVVIGSKTFGKGSVQQIKDPYKDEGRLKLTIQEYQLPGGVSIQDVGVTPDIKLIRHEMREDGSVDLVPPSRRREEDDEFALKNKVAYDHVATYELGWLAKYQTVEQARKSGESALAATVFSPDQEATLVLDLVTQAAASDGFSVTGEKASKQRGLRSFMLDRMKEPFMRAAASEAQNLATALNKHTSLLVWGNDTTPSDGSLTVTYTGPETLMAGVTTPVTFTVSNSSDADIGRLYGVVQSDRYSPLRENEVVFGQVDAKGKVSGALSFAVPPRTYAGEERFTLELFSDHGGKVRASVPVTLTIKEQPRPHFSYTWRLEEPGGNGQLDTDEAAIIYFTVINDGKGPSNRLSLWVFKDNDSFVQLGHNGEKIEPLQPGASATVAVPLTVLKEAKRGDVTEVFSANSIKLEVHIDERFDEKTDARFRTSLVHTLNIPLGSKANPKPLVQPSLSLLDTIRDGNKATLTVAVADDNLRLVTTFLNDDKIDLIPAARLAQDGKYHVSMILKPGVNNIRVFALDRDDMQEILPIRLWGDGVVEVTPVAVKPSKATATKPPEIP